MRAVFGLAVLALAGVAHAADAPPPGGTIKCTGIEERQVRELAADEKGRLKKGDFGPVETLKESFEHMFKTYPFRVIVKDRGSITSTETCEVEDDTFTCTTRRGQSPMPYVVRYNLATGAYTAVNDDELVKSRRRGTCDMTQARALLKQAKNAAAK